jgi:hypothetical protein
MNVHTAPVVPLSRPIERATNPVAVTAETTG